MPASTSGWKSGRNKKGDRFFAIDPEGNWYEITSYQNWYAWNGNSDKADVTGEGDNLPKFKSPSEEAVKAYNEKKKAAEQSQPVTTASGAGTPAEKTTPPPGETVSPAPRGDGQASQPQPPPPPSPTGLEFLYSGDPASLSPTAAKPTTTTTPQGPAAGVVDTSRKPPPFPKLDLSGEEPIDTAIAQFMAWLGEVYGPTTTALADRLGTTLNAAQITPEMAEVMRRAYVGGITGKAPGMETQIRPPKLIPVYRGGGRVPGPLGSPQLAVVHGGEEIFDPLAKPKLDPFEQAVLDVAMGRRF